MTTSYIIIDRCHVVVFPDEQREGPPEYSGKILGSSIQGIQAEYSVGSENEYFSEVDRNHFHKKVCREDVKKIIK